MRVLIGCEFSGIVREAFKSQGHDAWSCDLLPTEILGQHLQYDVLSVIDDGWDLAIFHPPCTHLATSGARWFKDKVNEQKEALIFVEKLLNVNIPKVALENPVGIISSKIRKPDQIIQPYMFGHKEAKKTCLWLKNLPTLVATEIVEPEYVIFSSGKKMPKWYNLPQSKNRSTIRSRTFEGIAKAMATQWS